MYENPGAGALDYFPCRYGKSKLLFRGPKRKLGTSYCAMLGGTETYGKFVPVPFPDLVAERTGKTVINLGCVNAGVDAFSTDGAVLDVCGGAKVAVVQVLGAQNMSNRFYAVHPRRNDRFLRASTLMKTLFREVDFTEFHFTRHMLTKLSAASPEKFALIVEELKKAWVARMQILAQKLGCRTVLLHLKQNPQPAGRGDGLGEDPLFIDDEMIAATRPFFTETIQITPSPDAIALGTEGMVFTPLEEPAAQEMPGLAVHREIADELGPVVERLMR